MVNVLFGLILCFHLLFASTSLSEAKTVLPIATEDYPPYEMIEEVGGLRGFDYEVVNAAFGLLGYETDIEFLPWKRALAYARLGKVVGILTCAYTDERAEFMSFSDPISKFVNGFYVLKEFDGLEPNILEDIVGQKVGSVSAYESFKALQAVGVNPFEASDTLSAIQMLRKKRFDYLYLGQQSTDFKIKQLGLSDEFRFYPVSKQSFYFCFSKQYPEYERIADEFNKALFILKRNGTYDEIHNKYR